MPPTLRRDPLLPDLTGRVAAVTGASRGIGAGIARRFAAAGAHVLVGYRSDAESAHRTAAALTGDGAGARAVAAQVDVTDVQSCAAFVARAVAEFGALDTMVNNAGVQPVVALAEMTADQWHDVMHTNAGGTFAVTQAAAAAMRERGGSIVHIASIEGTRPAPGHAHYAAAKAAVIMHAKAAALEYGEFGIRVNAVSPGLIDRPGLADEWPDGVARYRAAAPLGRLGTADEIGDACVFLSSDLARWVTGTDLVVDGGMSVRPAW